MAENTDRDWRVTEGPAIGAEPEFEVSEVQLRAIFSHNGPMSRSITAILTTSTPTQVESLGLTLPQLSGLLQIFEFHPQRIGLFRGGVVDLAPARGVLELSAPDRYVVSLYLPPDQFALLLPLLAPAPAVGRLRIEVERLLDQGVDEPDDHFWNDQVSPAVMFNYFEITYPYGDGSADDEGAPSPVS